MMKLINSLLLSLMLAACSSTESIPQSEVTTFVLVRHAEKVDDSRDPDLSETGYERAERLSEVLGHIPFSAVYSTDFKRTRETARPVASKNGLDIIEYDHREFDTMIPRWIESHKGQNVLIVGHSNSTPTAANGILGREHFEKKFDESDFGNILIVTVPATQENSRLVHLRY